MIYNFTLENVRKFPNKNKQYLNNIRLSNSIDMSKVTLDMNTFKALASDTRLGILRALDGKKMGLKDISQATKLNKATLHEHLTKLNEAGLVKRKEREGHKWVYYKLTWKGECLLHPENTRIVVLFSATFVALATGIIQMITYVKGTMVSAAPGIFLAGQTEALNESLVRVASEADGVVNNSKAYDYDTTFGGGNNGAIDALYQDPLFFYIALACFAIFAVVLCVSIWRYRKNKTPKL